jgi:hypothetical protein
MAYDGKYHILSIQRLIILSCTSLKMLQTLSVVSLLTVAAAAPIRVSCVGDSITAGSCSSKTNGYPAVLQGVLGSNYVVGNYGNSGKTMLKDGLCGPPASGTC